MIVLTLFMLPVQYHQESGKHSAQMSKVGYVIGCAASDAQTQFQNHITYNQPLGLDGERERYYEQLVVGECHAVTQKDAVDSTGS